MILVTLGYSYVDHGEYKYYMADANGLQLAFVALDAKLHLLASVFIIAECQLKIDFLIFKALKITGTFHRCLILKHFIQMGEYSDLHTHMYNLLTRRLDWR